MKDIVEEEPKLESDEEIEFCPYPRLETSLSNWEKLTLADNQEVIRVLKILTKKFSINSIAERSFTNEYICSDLQNAFNYYLSNKFSVRPASFYSVPKELPKICYSSPVNLSRGEVIDLMFKSNFIPRYEPFREEYSKYKENHRVYARMWRHPKGESLGTVIGVHGLFMGDPRVNAVTLVPGFFFRLGLDVILYEMPYHGRRVPAGTDNKSLFPSSNIARTNEGFAQAIYDLRSLAAWVSSNNDKPVGTFGISLGGYTSALWASLDKLDFVISVVPLVSMSQFVWKFIQNDSVASKIKEQNLELAQLKYEDLEAIYSMHCPLSYPPKVQKERRLIIASIEDPIIPKEQAELLWKHWDCPNIHWLSGGHLGQVVEDSALQVIYKFLYSNNLCLKEPMEIGEKSVGAHVQRVEK